MNTLTEHNWDELVTASPLPVFVLFHSTFTSYSRRSMALVLKLEPQFPTIRFGSLDVDKWGAMAVKHNIRGIPSFVIYRGGLRRIAFMGERSEKRMVENIARALVL